MSFKQRKKKGQLGHVIIYLFVALSIVAGSLFGYKAVASVLEKKCQVEISDFASDLENLEEGVHYGSVEERSLFSPCDVDGIYFVDLEKEINLNAFDNLPVIKDMLRSGFKRNLFLVKENELKGSFYASNFELGYPYFKCLAPWNDKINFFLEGRGAAVDIIPGCSQPECTYVPEKIGLDKADALAESISFKREHTVVENTETEVRKAIETIDKVDIFRKYQYCPDSGIAKVEIIVRPKKGVEAGDFRLFEYIPKECIFSLDDVLAEELEGIEGEYTVEVQNDPLIMWHFDELTKEEKVSYQLRKQLGEEDCKKVIDSIGIAERINEEPVEEIIDTIIN